jgi:hypothetical protein
MVVSDGRAGGVDDEAGTATGRVQLQALGRVHEAALSFDLNDGRLDILEGGDRSGSSRGNGRGFSRHFSWRFSGCFGRSSCRLQRHGLFLRDRGSWSLTRGRRATTGHEDQRESKNNNYSDKGGEFFHGV